MIDLKALLKPDQGQPATPLQLVDKKGFETWLKEQPARVRKAVEGQGFKGEGFQLAILPGERDEWAAALGVANVDELSPWCLAKAAEGLPEGSYRVAGRSPGPAVLGWLLGQYRFERYKKEPSTKGGRVLLTDEPGKVVRGAGKDIRVTDGPYSETKEVFGGYYTVTADSYDKAIDLGRGACAGRRVVQRCDYLDLPKGLF